MNSVKPVWFFSGLFLVSVFFSKHSETHLQFWKHSLNIWRPRAGLVLVCGFLSLVPLCWFNHFSFSLAFSYLSSLSLFWSSSPPPPPSDSEVLFWEMFEKLHRKLSADTESTGRQPINNSMNTEITLCTLLWPRVVTVQGPPPPPPGSEQEAGFGGQLEDS